MPQSGWIRNKTIYELGQINGDKWWCRDKTRPGLILVDNGNGHEFDFPQDALQACCDAASEYDVVKRKRPIEKQWQKAKQDRPAL